MLHPAALHNVYYYPFGNTPAVLLTQTLAPEEDAKVLILGCGDPRSILYTIHSVTSQATFGNKNRLDFTCCDIEPAVIARNVLIFTLIADDETGAKHYTVWNIMYHLYLDTISLEVLKTQAEKLLTLSETLGKWHKSTYGKYLRICNQDTLHELRHLWALYAQPLIKKVEDRYKNGLEELKEQCDAFFGMGLNSSNAICRTAGPLYVEALKQDLHNTAAQLFWMHGTTSIHPAEIKAARMPNVTMLYTGIGGDRVLICPGSNPLLGFHLSAAFAKLKPAALSQKLPGCGGTRSPPLVHIINTCHSQFKSWCDSFRRALTLGDDLRIRFFNGDALAFCQTLGLYCEPREETFRGPTSAMFYTSSRRMTPLLLDGCDYHSEAILMAPCRFNVIETSNLTDHIGLLNILLVARPLLTKEHSSVIYTESFFRWKGTESQALDAALGGDVSMISVLLGIAPLPFICRGQTTNNYTAHANRTLEFLLNEYPDQDEVNTMSYQRYEWRYPPLGDTTSLDQRKAEWQNGPNQKSLAKCLFEIHKVLFMNEERFARGQRMDPETPTSSQELIQLKFESLVHNTRQTFAQLIHLVKLKINMVNWSGVIKELLALLKADSCFPFSSGFLAELETHLHLLDVRNISTPNDVPEASIARGLPGWRVMPSLVCVVLVVPRQALDVFSNEEQGLACLYMQASVRNQKLHNNFCAIHTMFGEVHGNGQGGEHLELSVEEDRSGWYGKSNLIVAWMVPSWRLTLTRPEEITVALQLLLTPRTAILYQSKLRPALDIYCTGLYGKGQVFLAKDLPGLTSAGDISHKRYMMHCEKAPLEASEQDWLQLNEIPGVSPKSGSQESSQLTVQTRDATPSGLSTYLKITAPITTKGGDNTAIVTPVILTRNSNTVVPWNLPRIYLDTLPALDMDDLANYIWLKRHAQDMRGHRSLSHTPNPMAKGGPNPNTFLAICLGIHSPELTNKSPKVIYLCCQSDNTKGIVVLLADVRLNFDSGTIVLDACVVANQAAFEIALASQLEGGNTYRQFDCCEEMLEAWRRYLPAITERCRTWTHNKANCKYFKGKQILISEEPGMNPLCSCATGTFRAEPHHLAAWGLTNMAGAIDAIAMNGTRAAITPFFCGSWEDPEYGPCHDTRDTIKKAKNPQRMKATTARCEGCQWYVDLEDIKKCAKCKKALYCSRECQKKDWLRQHKKDCANYCKMKEASPEVLEIMLRARRAIMEMASR